MSTATAKKSSVRRGSKQKKRAPSTGKVHVKATFNNTIISVTSMSGDVVTQASGGLTQKGARKGTAFAAEEAAKHCGGRAKDMGMIEVHVFLDGAGSGREAAVRGVLASGLKVMSITEATKAPHNGARRRKEKRN